MRTLVVSDLHLGELAGDDVLRHAGPRAALVNAARDADRLVILGDGFELRQAPVRDIPGVAGPLLAELGAAIGEIVLLTGNHDHGLTAGWIEERLETEPPGFLGLEQRLEPAEAGRLATALAELAAPARVSLAYPGIFLREDVYAFHGHYLDLHSRVPTFERLVAGAMARWVVGVREAATPDDYEAALAPLYAWLHQLAQRTDSRAVTSSAGISRRAWVALSRERGGPAQRARRLALGAGYAAAVAALDRAGLGPLDRDLSGTALRAGTLHGIREVCRRLRIEAPWVIFGHTHRSGPWPGDDAAEWTTHSGGRLINTGSWVHQRHFIAGSAPGRSPYWPGTAVWVGESGPPRLARLLTGPLPR